jgi:FkbM family methyltransferase
MINWSAIDRRSLAGRLLRLPARALPARCVMRVRQGPARGMKWIAGSSVHGCWLGTYEFEKQKSLERFIRPGMTIYDVGAQAGFYTLFFSRLAGGRGKVFAFEPCAYEARFLIDHVRLNHLDNVRVIQAAVAEKRELLPMSSDRGMCENRLGDVPDATLMVPTISLDSSGLPVPDLIKMDVEGAETAVLLGAQRTLREARPVLFVALHGDEQRKTCSIILRDAGYSIHDLDGRRLSGALSVDEIYALPVEVHTM